MSRSRVSEWFVRFRDGRESTEDDERSDRPRSNRNDENVEKVQLGHSTETFWIDF